MFPGKPKGILETYIYSYIIAQLSVLIWYSNPTPRNLLKRNENMSTKNLYMKKKKKKTYTSVHSNIIHNSQKIEITQVPTN
jgi:hypothetical protein